MKYLINDFDNILYNNSISKYIMEIILYSLIDRSTKVDKYGYYWYNSVGAIEYGRDYNLSYIVTNYYVA